MKIFNRICSTGEGTDPDDKGDRPPGQGGTGNGNNGGVEVY